MKKLTFLLLCYFALASQLSAQLNLFEGEQKRIVVFARFNGDPDIDTPRNTFEKMFNGENHSLKSYFNAVSNNKLSIHSLMYPVDTISSHSYELKYCYYCYDTDWKGSYPNCKGSDITALFDVNIGFIIKELAGNLEGSGDLPDATELDSDDDGNVDNFVILFRGAARGMGKGVYSPQVGVVSPTFTNVHGDIKLKGKTIRNYSILFERNSLDTHSRYLLTYMGFPPQYRNTGSLIRSVGPWDPMDGTHLSYPLAYNRMKYTNAKWVNDIPQITQPGVYTLAPVNQTGNNAYKLLSSDPKQFWVLECRDKSAEWESDIPASGLLIYRVNTNYTGSVTANPEIYLYRKNGTPAVAGDIKSASFSNLNGQIAFNATSNPYAFLSDGSVSNDIDISDITFDGNNISFKVNKVYTDLVNISLNKWNVSVDSKKHLLKIEGENLEQLFVVNTAGVLLNTIDLMNVRDVDLSYLPSGIYIIQLTGKSDKKTFKINLF